jgi:hypothetical protein
LNELTDFKEIWWEGHATEGDLNAIIFNSAASANPKWQTFKPRWMQNFHQSTWNHEILYRGRSSEDKQLLIRPLLQKTNNINMADS